jgi:Ca2+/Na+ antiporter
MQLVLLGTFTLSFMTWRVGSVQVSDGIFLCAAVVIAFKLLAGADADLAPAHARRGTVLVLVGSLLLIAGGTLSSFRSWNPTESMSVVLRFAWVTLVLFWLLRTVCRDRDDLDRVLRAWKASCLVNAGAALLGMAGIAFETTHNGDRQVGLTFHPNHLSAQLAATFVFFLVGVPAARGLSARRAQIWWLVALGAVSVALFSTGSLTGLAAVLVGMAAAAATFVATRAPSPRRRRSPLTPFVVIAVLAAGAVLLFTSDLPVVDRLLGLREGDRHVVASVDSRGRRNEMVIDRFDQFLVVGYGFNLGTARLDPINPDNPAVRNFGVHNMYLSVLYQAGLPALLGVLLMLTTTLRQLVALRLRADPHLRMLVVGLVGSFAAVTTTAMFQPTTFDRFFWMPVALTGALWSIRRRELRAARHDAAPRTSAA